MGPGLLSLLNGLRYRDPRILFNENALYVSIQMISSCKDT